MEAVSYFTDQEGAVYWITDVFNTLQGVIIFLLFVLKSRVQRLVIGRFVNKFTHVAPNKLCEMCKRNKLALIEFGDKLRHIFIIPSISPFIEFILRLRRLFGCVEQPDSSNVKNTTSRMRPNQMAVTSNNKSQPKP